MEPLITDLVCYPFLKRSGSIETQSLMRDGCYRESYPFLKRSGSIETPIFACWFSLPCIYPFLKGSGSIETRSLLLNNDSG